MAKEVSPPIHCSGPSSAAASPPSGRRPEAGWFHLIAALRETALRQGRSFSSISDVAAFRVAPMLKHHRPVLLESAFSVDASLSLRWAQQLTNEISDLQHEREKQTQQEGLRKR
jgi:hypothetical protein